MPSKPHKSRADNSLDEMNSPSGSDGGRLVPLDPQPLQAGAQAPVATKSLGMNESQGSDGGFLVAPQHAKADDGALSTKSMISGTGMKEAGSLESKDDAGRKVPQGSNLEDMVRGATNMAHTEAPTGAMAPGPETSALIHEQAPGATVHPGGTRVVPLDYLQRMELARVQQLQRADGLQAQHRARYQQVTKHLLAQAQQQR